MQEFQIKELPEEGKIEKAIVEYNLRHRVPLCKNAMLNFYSDLLRLGSFKETARFNHMSKATLYRYKDRFRKIGITDNNLIPLTEDGIPGAELDLREYHHTLTFDYPRLLNRKEFLDLL